MNKFKYFLIIIVIVIVLGAGFFIFKSPVLAPTPTPNVVDIKQNVENYLRANISKLSPVKAVLGGTWYVVSITTDLEKNSGTVVYEDGHIQEIKNFSYTTNNNGEIISLIIADPNNPVACTMEAKLCPDGSYVSRTGPNCEFAKCPAPPTPNPVPVSTGYVAGHITIGPNCPVEQADHPCPTPPSAYSSRQVVVYKSDGSTIKTTGKIDAQGNYKIALAPGTYFIQIQPAGIGPGEKKQVVITANNTGTVDFNIDTGIR
jgi:hypothetical protein